MTGVGQSTKSLRDIGRTDPAKLLHDRGCEPDLVTGYDASPTCPLDVVERALNGVRLLKTRRIQLGPFRLFPAQQLLLEGEAPVRLGGRARDLLIALLEQAGQVITKEALSARLWPNIIVEEGTLRVHVAALRKALRDGQEGRRFIANIAGRGYAFVGELVATDEPDHAAEAPPEPMPPLSMVRLFGRSEVV